MFTKEEMFEFSEWCNKYGFMYYPGRKVWISLYWETSKTTEEMFDTYKKEKGESNK
jgi:hypothetical protein